MYYACVVHWLFTTMFHLSIPDQNNSCKSSKDIFSIFICYLLWFLRSSTTVHDSAVLCPEDGNGNWLFTTFFALLMLFRHHDVWLDDGCLPPLSNPIRSLDFKTFRDYVFLNACLLLLAVLLCPVSQCSLVSPGWRMPFGQMQAD